ncbi:MAG: glycosyltransferase family 4 protein [Planctomycetota bacterium]
MHLTIFLDQERLDAEPHRFNAILERLCDADHTINCIVPADHGSRMIELDESPDEDTHPNVTRYRIPMNVLPWTRRLVARRIAETLEPNGTEVIWALGTDSWQVASDVARRMECPVALDVWCPAVARRAVRLRGAPIASYMVPTRALADWMRERVDPDIVSLVPPGVSDGQTTEFGLSAMNDGPICLGIIGRGRDASAYAALLGGVRQVVSEYSAVQLFMELAGRAEHEIWRQVQHLDLLDRTSTFTSAVGVRTLVARCHALLLPERYGEINTIMLEAMRDGVPIIASADPALAGIVDQETALLVEDQSATAWAHQLRHLLGHLDEVELLAREAANRVRTAYRLDRQVEILTGTFERMVRGDAFEFGRAPAAGLSDEG